MHHFFPMGEPRHVVQDDGSVFLATPVNAPGWAFHILALVINEEIQAKARALLVPATSLANAKATRLSFVRRSRDVIGVTAGDLQNVSLQYQRAEDESKAATEMMHVLHALAMGETFVGDRVITVADWRDILEKFYQDTSCGAVRKVEG